VLLAIALVAFASLGLPDGVLGVAWPSIRRGFDLPPAQLGVLLASAMVGYVASSFSSGALVARLGIGRLLFWSSVLMVANSLAYAAAPAWSVMVAAALFAGLGAGAIDAGINTFAAIHFSSRVVTWLHASYGVGAALGPLLMSAALATGPGWRGGYAAIAAILAAMAIVFRLTRRRWDVAPPRPAGAGGRAPAPGLLTTLRRPRVWLNVALFFVYTGLEVSAGQWTYSLLTEARGVAPAAAGAWIASYWAGLTAGRIVSGAAAGRFAAATVLRAATLGAVASTLLLWRDPGMGLGLLALAALGCCLAPIYPLLIAETPGRIGAEHAAAAIGFQVAAAYLGAAAIPGATGVLATTRGDGAIAPCLFVTALLLLALHELARRRAVDRDRDARARTSAPVRRRRDGARFAPPRRTGAAAGAVQSPAPTRCATRTPRRLS
jgi:fucose permease